MRQERLKRAITLIEKTTDVFHTKWEPTRYELHSSFSTAVREVNSSDL